MGVKNYSSQGLSMMQVHVKTDVNVTAILQNLPSLLLAWLVLEAKLFILCS